MKTVSDASTAVLETYLEPSTPSAPRLLDDALSAASRAASLPPVPRRARVLEVLGGRRVRVQIDAVVVDATLATSSPYAPSPGDRVLVLPSPDGAFVLGVLEAREVSVRTTDGAQASVAGDVLTVRAPSGELLFTHDAATGKSELRAREVSVCADELRLEGRAVTIVADEELSLERGGDALRFDERGVALDAGRLAATVTAARFAMKEVVFGAERVESAVKRARQVVDVAELRAGRLVQRARSVFRETEEVEQVRAGRIRMVAKAAYQVLADRVTVTAEQDLTLMGDKINLA